MIVQRAMKRLRGGRRPSLQWTIVTSAPKGEPGKQWGDTWFAHDLARALRRGGQRAKVASRAGARSQARNDDDVVLVLRGLKAVEPPADRSAVWMLWVISHPELVSAEELRSYDAVFVASEHWRAPEGVPVTPLLQATDPERFTPEASSGADSGVLFVGSTRGEFRPVVRGALRSSRASDLRIYGVGWPEFVDESAISGEFLPNEELPAAYADAQIVLNDHHRQMAEEGFLSNRLFDAVAAGARVLTDRAQGVQDVFGDSVVVFDDEDDLVALLDRPTDEVFAAHSARVRAAAKIAQKHSFDARAQVLIDRAMALREVS